ncbi:MAG: hypothetical protein IPP07_04275 [Holophagales bacterium]|nr:hypothetical protein [Holophagales bacterium]
MYRAPCAPEFPSRTLAVTLFLAAGFVVALLPATALAAEAPSGATPGITFAGSPGVTETTSEIMARAAKEPPTEIQRVTEPKKIRPDRTKLPQDPDALPVAQWPPLPEGGNDPQAFTPFSPQTLGTTFLGATLAGVNPTSAFPPDSMGAVGPTQYIVAVNGRIVSFSKTTGLADGVLNATTNTFFNSVRNGAGTSDPRIRYDRLTQRWIVVIINVSFPNRILVAVSNAASAGVVSGSTVWTYFFLAIDTAPPAISNTCLMDYPTLGVDANALYIGGNNFCGAAPQTFHSTDGWVIRKSSVLGAGPIVATVFRALGTGAVSGPYTPQGVDNYDPAATEGYFIGTDTRFYGRLNLRRVSTPAGTPAISANVSVTNVSTTSGPLNVPHLGNTGGANGQLDALDERLYAAHFRSGKLLTAHNIGVNAVGVASGTLSRTATRWYEITGVAAGNTPTVSQSGTVYDPLGTNPVFYWIPSIMVSGQGHAAMGFSTAGANARVNAGTVGRLVGDTPGTTGTPVNYTASSTAYNPGSDTGVDRGARRWGDYSYTSLAPNDDMTMWTIQQFCNATNSYGVQVVKLLAPPPATPATCTPTSVVQGASNVSVVVTGTSTSGSGFFDPAGTCSTCSSHIAATVSGTGVTVNSVSYTDPTHVTLNLTVAAGAAAGVRNVTVTNPDGQAVTGTGILTVRAPCATITGTVTGGGTVCAGSPSSVTVTVSGRNASVRGHAEQRGRYPERCWPGLHLPCQPRGQHDVFGGDPHRQPRLYRQRERQRDRHGPDGPDDGDRRRSADHLREQHDGRPGRQHAELRDGPVERRLRRLGNLLAERHDSRRHLQPHERHGSGGPALDDLQRALHGLDGRRHHHGESGADDGDRGRRADDLRERDDDRPRRQHAERRRGPVERRLRRGGDVLAERHDGRRHIHAHERHGSGGPALDDLERPLHGLDGRRDRHGEPAADDGDRRRPADDLRERDDDQPRRQSADRRSGSVEHRLRRRGHVLAEFSDAHGDVHPHGRHGPRCPALDDHPGALHGLDGRRHHHGESGADDGDRGRRADDLRERDDDRAGRQHPELRNGPVERGFRRHGDLLAERHDPRRHLHPHGRHGSGRPQVDDFPGALHGLDGRRHRHGEPGADRGHRRRAAGHLHQRQDGEPRRHYADRRHGPVDGRFRRHGRLFAERHDPRRRIHPHGGVGPVVLRWTISNATCTASTADVTVTVNPAPTTATVGGSQIICASGTTIGLGGNAPTSGTGQWSVVSGGTGVFSPNATTPGPTFTHTGGAGPLVLRWTISREPCPASTADVTVTVNPAPTSATTGGPQTVATNGTTTSLGGNTPSVGTGQWSIVSGGTGVFAPNGATPGATFTHTGGAGPVVLRWTITSASCPASTADVLVTIHAADASTRLFNLTPCRLVDTRDPAGPLGGPAIGAGQTRVFPLVGVCGIPTGAVALVLNVTGVTPAAAGSFAPLPGERDVRRHGERRVHDREDESRRRDQQAGDGRQRHPLGPQLRTRRRGPDPRRLGLLRAGGCGGQGRAFREPRRGQGRGEVARGR